MQFHLCLDEVNKKYKLLESFNLCSYMKNLYLKSYFKSFVKIDWNF